MLKHITPADPAASIPDLGRGGFLPSAGLDTELTVYWLGLALRGDIVIADARGSGGASPPLPDASLITGGGYFLRINGVERLFSLTDLQAILTPLLGGTSPAPGDGSVSDLTTNLDDEANSALVPGLTA